MTRRQKHALHVLDLWAQKTTQSQVEMYIASIVEARMVGNGERATMYVRALLAMLQHHLRYKQQNTLQPAHIYKE